MRVLRLGVQAWLCRPRGALPAVHPPDYRILQWRTEERERISDGYVCWVSTLAQTILATEGLGATARRARVGRAAGPVVKWSRLRATPGRTHMKNSFAEWWGITTTLLVRYRALARNGVDPSQA
eukprot:4933418-Pyramimonas_sp.AAC.1